MNHPAKLHQQIKAASDAFAMMVETHFAAWNLTAEESAVARLGLQGYGVDECADILQTRPEIAEHHQNNVFFKVGVSCWSDLMRFMTEQLLSGAKRETPCPFVWS
ncbi:hypothetical protein FIV00_03360 [Labrenzia sp. THAF82]|uniref:helix-turn-helix transcriptional regulator n=1 Tax=Labrenzia sp. THAF82 TaxID=2587861 RepID=UPI0012A7EC43|nr:helix-turn-helix transcriptional regulator [Labrenzia sp. THAF82]QFT29510.1 hypothetical protein FIV00_03360 [Labrenzia sp. THAF82]